MLKFVIFNYRFEPNLQDDLQLQIKFPEYVNISAKGSFEKRQEIFGNILLDDFRGNKAVSFSYKRKPYCHVFVTQPVDDIFVMRMSNKKTTYLTGRDFVTSAHDDYPYCIVVIDNRPGIQRILIEQKAKAFDSVSTVANIMQTTFNKLLKYWKLTISIDAIYRTSEFMNTVKQWPNGFRKVTLHLPPKNLERVMEDLEQTLADVREDWDAAMDISFKALKGGIVHIDPNNKRQMGFVNLGASIGGGSIEMIPAGKSQPSVWCGKDKFVTESINDGIFKEMEKGPVDMFKEDNAIDRLKLALKAIKNRYD